jgi:hypothetical protein
MVIKYLIVFGKYLKILVFMAANTLYLIIILYIAVLS